MGFLRKVWNKITIGRHSLESSGAGIAHSARYVNPRNGRYDGVHLYGQTGCKDYTDSVKTILMLAQSEQNSRCGTTQTDNHDNCPQAKFQKKTKCHPSVPTKNRFSVFNSNTGNY